MTKLALFALFTTLLVNGAFVLLKGYGVSPEAAAMIVFGCALVMMLFVDVTFFAALPVIVPSVYGQMQASFASMNVDGRALMLAVMTIALATFIAIVIGLTNFVARCYHVQYSWTYAVVAAEMLAFISGPCLVVSAFALAVLAALGWENRYWFVSYD